jgi:aryl-alcohol dehydrogenase-like predicted oxidoreductase
MYGDNEELVGKWLKRTGKRDDIFLATKFGFVKDGVVTPNLDSSGKFCIEACEASLKLLGTDYIDLYYAHRLKFETPVEDTMRGLAELKA